MLVHLVVYYSSLVRSESSGRSDGLKFETNIALGRFNSSVFGPTLTTTLFYSA